MLCQMRAVPLPYDPVQRVHLARSKYPLPSPHASWKWAGLRRDVKQSFITGVFDLPYAWDQAL